MSQIKVRKAIKKPIPIDYVLMCEGVSKVCSWVKKGGGHMLIHHPYTGEGTLHTAEGNMIVGNGDVVIKGVVGEFYAVRSFIFFRTYDLLHQGEEDE